LQQPGQWLLQAGVSSSAKKTGEESTRDRLCARAVTGTLRLVGIVPCLLSPTLWINTNVGQNNARLDQPSRIPREAVALIPRSRCKKPENIAPPARLTTARPLCHVNPCHYAPPLSPAASAWWRYRLPQSSGNSASQSNHPRHRSTAGTRPRPSLEVSGRSSS
jgi:hypothetical protein